MATSMAVGSLRSFGSNTRSIISSNSTPLPKSSVSLRPNLQPPPIATVAGAVFSALAIADPAIAVQHLAEIADADNRGLALLFPIIPAIAWVLLNILQPALNQINRMSNSKGLIVGLGIGGLAASWLAHGPAASAKEIAQLAEAAAATGNDNRGKLLLFVIAPAIAWVLFNILQPALNQINRMRSK